MASGGEPIKEATSEGQGSPKGSLSYSVVARRERSKVLAQKRRTTYKTIMDDLTQTLPFPKDVVSQLDYNSRLRLALCFFRLKSLLDSAQSRTNGGTNLEEEKLREKVAPKDTHGMLSEFMNEALDGFLMVALTDGTITYLSESIHKHLGLFQSEHIGISLFDLILEEDHESVRETIHKAEVTALARLGQSASAEVGFFCRMKCSRFKVTNTISKTPGYKLVYISGSLKMASNETFLVVVVRPVSPPSILEIKVEGNMFVTHYTMQMKCIFFDGRLFQLLGYNKTDLLGDVVFTLHHHDDMEATMECSRGVMTRGEGLSGYFRFLTKYGYYVWVQTRATVMYDSRTGKPSYIVCMNFVIDREKGEATLRKRALESKEADDPVITEVETQDIKSHDRSHDPFPLVSREDGKVVNPLHEPEDQGSPASLYSEVSSSSSSVSRFDSSPFSTAAQSSSVYDEPALPDSTSVDMADSAPSNLQMVRTNTKNSVQSADTGYSSSSTSSNNGGTGLFSPEAGASEISSMSHSPYSDVSLSDRKSSPENPSSIYSSPPENPPSVFSSSPGSSTLTGGGAPSAQGVGGSTNSLHSVSSVSSHQSPSGQYVEQNSQLSSLLTSNVRLASSTELPQSYEATPTNIGVPQNAHAQQGRGVSAQTQLLGKRRPNQEGYIKEEVSFYSDFVPHPNTTQGGVGPVLPQMQATSYQHNGPPPLITGHHGQNQMPGANQEIGSVSPQSLPQGNQQFYAPQHTNGLAPTPSQSGHVYHQQSLLPDWTDQVAVKKEFENFGHVPNQQFQQPHASNQGYPFTQSKQPPMMAQFPQQGATIDLTALPSSSVHQQPFTVGNLTQMQGSKYSVGNHCMSQTAGRMGMSQVPFGTGMSPMQNGMCGQEQLPLLTSEDMSVLDDLDRYSGPNFHQVH